MWRLVTFRASGNMKNLLRVFNSKKSLEKNERGQGMAEYIIIVILVAIIVLVAIRLFGKSIFNQFNNATSSVDSLEKGP